MTALPQPTSRPWRVAVTRDEPADGPLSQALRAAGFLPAVCPVLEERPAADPDRLAAAAAALDGYDWLVCASARAVRTLAAARHAPWPPALRTAAVGAGTARALVAAGAVSPPLTGDGDGADALWTRLATADRWPGRRVLLPTTPGGRRVLAEALAAAGARVDEVEAYRMEPRPPAVIAAAFAALDADAVTVASPRVATALVAAVGAATLARRAVVAIGNSTAAALDAAGISYLQPPTAAFPAIAARLAAHRDGVEG